MTPAVIRSTADLTQQIDTLARETSLRWWFRGHRTEAWELLPHVRRNHTPEQERYLSHEFRARAGLRHTARLAYNDIPNWLALMQHYGLPTRLMDWSQSALVAAFFAVEAAMPHSEVEVTTDACIWALAPGSLNASQGFEPLLYSLNSDQLRQRLLEPAFYPPDGDAIVLAAMAVESDIRMQVQRGAFTVHGSPTPLDRLEGSEQWLRKFLIPKDAVPLLARELRLLGVGLADLFPDLHNLARELRALHRSEEGRLERYRRADRGAAE
jgi:hypothetical protein